MRAVVATVNLVGCPPLEVCIIDFTERTKHCPL